MMKMLNFKRGEDLQQRVLLLNLKIWPSMKMCTSFSALLTQVLHLVMVSASLALVVIEGLDYACIPIEAYALAHISCSTSVMVRLKHGLHPCFNVRLRNLHQAML